MVRDRLTVKPASSVREAIIPGCRMCLIPRRRAIMKAIIGFDRTPVRRLFEAYLDIRRATVPLRDRPDGIARSHYSNLCGVRLAWLYQGRMEAGRRLRPGLTRPGQFRAPPHRCKNIFGGWREPQTPDSKYGSLEDLCDLLHYIKSIVFTGGGLCKKSTFIFLPF